MAVIYLFVGRFGSLNIQIYTFFSSESTAVIGFAFGHIVKKLSS